MLGFLVCVTFLLGFFFPPLWFLTAIFLIGMSASGPGKRGKPVREMTYQENVRWYKKHGVDYDEWMMKLNPRLPIPGKPHK